MSSLYRSADDTTPLYSVVLNDGSSDGGNNSTWYITSGSTNVSDEDMRTACQAFADSLSESVSYTIVAVKRQTVTDVEL